MMKRFGKDLGGFTLIESLFAAMVLSVAVAGLALPFSVAARHQRIDTTRSTALSLANQMMERLLNLTYAQVKALDGLSEAGKTITAVNGVALNEACLIGFGREVSVQEVAVPLEGQPIGEAATFLRVTVRVTHEGREAATMTRLYGQIGGG